MTVNLTRIYTRLGDGGETHLGDMSRVPKTHPRIEAYGTVDELGAQIGVALTVDGLPDGYAEWLRHIQNDLFDVGADISAPEDPERERLRVIPEQTAWLEQRCDEVNATLEPLKSFVLPGGTAAAAHLHVCRTVCRRAERLAIACGEEVNAEVVRYLNRLSDLLFILAAAPTAARSRCGSPVASGTSFARRSLLPAAPASRRWRAPGPALRSPTRRRRTPRVRGHSWRPLSGRAITTTTDERRRRRSSARRRRSQRLADRQPLDEFARPLPAAGARWR